MIRHSSSSASATPSSAATAASASAAAAAAAVQDADADDAALDLELHSAASVARKCVVAIVSMSVCFALVEAALLVMLGLAVGVNKE